MHDTVKPGELELGLRERAKTLGVRLLDHRDMSDVAGRESEIQAALKNLDRIPTSVTFGGDSARVTATITGTVTAEAKVGGAKIEAEGSPGGAKAKVSGAGGSAGVEVSDKGVKAELKAGDFVTVEGEIAKQADGSMGWRAEIAIGTLGTHGHARGRGEGDGRRAGDVQQECRRARARPRRSGHAGRARRRARRRGVRGRREGQEERRPGQVGLVGSALVWRAARGAGSAGR